MAQLNEYLGPLTRSTDHNVRIAYSKYMGQRRRCYGRAEKDRSYWSKGLQVEYSAREFIAWYLEAIKSCDIKNPHVGRIDHDKGYSLNNIVLQSIEENSSERILRAGNPAWKKRRTIYIYKDGQYFGTAETTRQAAALTGVSKSRVHDYLTRGVEKRFLFTLEKEAFSA